MTKFPGSEYFLKLKENELFPKRLQTGPKLQILTFLTIHFSFRSDKYSIIFKPLKIKFLWHQFQHFSIFSWNSTKFPQSKILLKMSENEFLPKSLQITPKLQKFENQVFQKKDEFLEILLDFSWNVDFGNSDFHQFCWIFRISRRLNSFSRWANFPLFLWLSYINRLDFDKKFKFHALGMGGYDLWIGSDRIGCQNFGSTSESFSPCCDAVASAGIMDFCRNRRKCQKSRQV